MKITERGIGLLVGVMLIFSAAVITLDEVYTYFTPENVGGVSTYVPEGAIDKVCTNEAYYDWELTCNNG